MTLGWRPIQYKVNSLQQEVRSVRLGHDGINRLQSTIGQFEVVSKHDDGNLWFDLLDLSRHSRTVQEAQVVIQNNGIHGQRHKKPQTVTTVSCGYHLSIHFPLASTDSVQNCSQDCSTGESPK